MLLSPRVARGELNLVYRKSWHREACRQARTASVEGSPKSFVAPRRNAEGSMSCSFLARIDSTAARLTTIVPRHAAIIFIARRHIGVGEASVKHAVVGFVGKREAPSQLLAGLLFFVRVDLARPLSRRGFHDMRRSCRRRVGAAARYRGRHDIAEKLAERRRRPSRDRLFPSPSASALDGTRRRLAARHRR